MPSSTSHNVSRGYFFILSAAVLWGTTGTSQALAPQAATPLSIGAIRLAVGSMALIGLATLKGGFRQHVRWPVPAVMVAGLTTAMYQICFFSGVRLTGVAVGTMVTIGSSPIFAAILGYFFRSEHLSARWFFATSTSVVGVVMLAVAGAQSIDANLIGILLALGAGLSYALFTLSNKSLVTQHSPDEVMAVTFSIGAVAMVPFLFLDNLRWLGSVGGLVVALHLGLIATGLSYSFFGLGLQSVPVSTTATLSLVEPLTAAMLGILVVGESLTPFAVMGMTLLFVGLAVLTIGGRSTLPG